MINGEIGNQHRFTRLANHPDFADTERNSSESAIEPGPIFMLVQRVSSTGDQMQATSLVWTLRPQITFFADISRSQEPKANQSNVGFRANSLNDHFHDRLRILLLSNVRRASFEERAT